MMGLQQLSSHLRKRNACYMYVPPGPSLSPHSLSSFILSSYTHTHTHTLSSLSNQQYTGGGARTMAKAER